MKTSLPIVLVILAAIVEPLLASSQQIGTNEIQGKDKTYTLNVKSQLVTESIVVRDKQGKLVSGLTAKDFTVTETVPSRRFVYLNESPYPWMRRLFR